MDTDKKKRLVKLRLSSDMIGTDKTNLLYNLDRLIDKLSVFARLLKIVHQRI